MENFQKVYIKGTGSFVPDKIVTNHDIAKNVCTSDEWVKERLGISARHICEENEYTSDIAFKAGLKAIEAAGLDREAIDLIIVATSTPDRVAPSTACLVKNKIGIKNHGAAFDVAAVCSGFVYALTTAASLIATGAHKNALVIGADTFSKITDWSRRDCVFFGDGAGAVVLSASDNREAFFYAKLYSETNNTDNFTVHPEDQYFTMNANAVYETGSTVLPQAIQEVLQDCGYTKDDLSCVIPHQPSVSLLRAAAKRLDVPFNLFETNMDSYANTSSATIPLLLDETVCAGKIQSGDLVMFAAVGSGWTWAAAILKWVE